MTVVFRSGFTDPAARGREFGERHSQRVRACVESYRTLFERVAAGRPFDLRKLGARALEQVAGFAPPLYDEMLGLAAGARIDAELIGSLNARTEILAMLKAPLRGECSVVVRLDPFMAPPLAVQTWDWYTDFADHWLVWEVPHADGSLTTTVTEFGIVGKAGVNSRGLGILFSILHHQSDGGEAGVPIHVLSRWVLDSTCDINAALQVLNATPVCASSCLTLVASVENSSAAVAAELYPGGAGLAFPARDGLLVHTNHFLTSPAAQGDTEPGQFPDTLVRHDLLMRRLTGRPDLDTTGVLDAMNTHLGRIGAICCHPDNNRPAAGQYATLATIILDVPGGKLRALRGGPCGHPTPLLESSPCSP